MKKLTNNKKLKILNNMLQFLQNASITTDKNTPLKKIKFFKSISLEEIWNRNKAIN